MLSSSNPTITDTDTDTAMMAIVTDMMVIVTDMMAIVTDMTAMESMEAMVVMAPATASE